MGHWQLYAAFTGSAMAMVTSGGVQHFNKETGSRLLAVEQAYAPPATQSTQSAPPVISAGGVVPLYGSASVIQPGEWVSIYGGNLAIGITVWKGDFPTTLGGTTVTINGKAAFLSLVSPGQINLQAPDDTATGSVAVVVTTAKGVARTSVTLSPYSPSFMLLDRTHVNGIILRKDGSGAYGGGTYDILGPTGNCFGYRTVGAKPGDIVEVYGTGFGPTTPTVKAGTVFSGVAPINSPLSLSLNNIPVQPSFAGLSGAGLYQINLVIPAGLGQGDISVSASIGGLKTQKSLMFSLDGRSVIPPVCVSIGDGGDGGDGSVGDGGTGGDGGGSGGDGGYTGDGGGGDGGGDGGDGGDGGGGDGSGDGGDGGGDGGDGGGGDGDGGDGG